MVRVSMIVLLAINQAAARVRAALRAAALRRLGPLVLAAFCADADREAGPRRAAASCACRASARCDAALRGSRFSASSIACDRLADGRLRAGRPCPRSYASSALLFVFSEPVFGGGKSTPARRAF